MQAAAIVAGLQTPHPPKKNDIRFFFRKLAPEKIGTKIGTSSCVPPKETKKKEGNSKRGGGVCLGLGEAPAVSALELLEKHLVLCQPVHERLPHFKKIKSGVRV